MTRPQNPLNARMTFGEHLEALRWHLIRALIAVAICMVACLIGGQGLLDFLLAPLRQALAAHQAGAVVVRNPMEGLMAYFEISLIAGLVLASPWVFYQLWGFVAPGLYPHEKRLVYVSLPILLGLFSIGVLFGWYVALPAALEFMVAFNLRLGFQLQITVSSWVSFALVFPLAFGITFELPLLMVLLSRIGLVSGTGFRRHRKIAILSCSVLSAVLTPTTDPLGMMLMFVPLVLLYEAGIWAVWCSEKRLFTRRGADRDSRVPPSDDLLTGFLLPVLAGRLARRQWAARGRL